MEMLNDYFAEQKEFIEKHYVMTKCHENKTSLTVQDVLGYRVNDFVRNLYEHYSNFSLSWETKQGKYVGYFKFIGYDSLTSEHEYFVEMMEECYDMETDEFKIAEDIRSWYPVIRFGNGDAFCLDARNGTVVFFEHDVIDSGQNLHGLRIASSLNNLFDKWSKIHFVDYYYWDEIVGDDGIDLSNKALHETLDL